MVNHCKDLETIVEFLLHWMQNETIVRILDAGRSRLAAAIPANRLAHGGARVFIQDDIIPMPHTVKGGGIIAASASGKTRAVLDVLKFVKGKAPHIVVIGIADHTAQEFEQYCSYFIGIHEVRDNSDPLRVLADFGEYVISELLDALVVAAGRQGGFDERKWRLGYENIDSTGPYDYRDQIQMNLLFSDLY